MKIFSVAVSIPYFIALLTNVLAVLVALYFIISDALRNSSSNNGMLSLLTLGMCVWIGLSLVLYLNSFKTIASAMLWIPAIPLLGYAFFVLMFIILKPDMK